MTNHLRQQFGNYRLLRAVGNGGFATVYLGEHIHLGTQAAIKVLKTDLPDEESEAFRTEARTIARLIHPHIVRVLDFGLKGRTPFLVMDYAPYGSLRGQFPAGRPLSLAKTLPYVKQVADALHYAHQRRVIHRDIKPENMLLDVQERVLLSDFGLAVVLTSSRQHTTFDMAGTIAYMAPEQIRGKPCPASDQYALGVVLYQWLTGILPFQGSPQEILLQHQASHPPSLRARGAEITPVVEAVIFQALAKEPRHRFDSVETFVTALLQAAQGRGQNTLPYELRVSFSRPAGFVPWCRTPQHPLVGRERELQVLRQLLQDSRKQDDSFPEQSLRRSCVLLAGDPGIGKTRLAEETSLLAQRQGWVVLWGRAHFSEQHMPYRVWIDVLRGALAYGSWPWPEVSASPERYRPLAALLPELAELFLTLPSPSGENLEQTQFRIWEAVLALFATICDHSPLLIVLDDLHWADHVSCQLLGYLVRNLASTRVFLIGSVREQEISATHPLRTLYNLFQQHRLVITLVLSALTASQVARLVAHLPPPVAEAIQKQAAGNPFFVEELARFPRPASTLTETALPSGPVLQRGALPPGIISIFEQRVAQLSQRTQKMLSYAAVLGDAFSFDVLRLMQTSENSSEDEDAQLDQLDEALQARLLLEEHAGMQILYHFWHPLLVDYLYTRLSAARRARLHGRAAYALREMMKNREGEAAATIVYHLVRGGSEASLLVRYAQLAGEHAHALAAYPEAEKHYRLALAQLGEVAPATPPEDYLIFAHLFECLGECSMVQGKFEEARTCYERAFALRDALPVSMREEERQDEAQRKALFSCEIGKTWHYLGKSHEAQQAYRRGEQILQKAKVVAGPAWAKIRFEEGYDHWRHGNFEEALRLAHEALRLFERFLCQGTRPEQIRFLTKVQGTLRGNPTDLGRVCVLLAAIEATKGQIADGLQHLNAALEIYTRHEHLTELAVIYTNLADLYLRGAEYPQAQAALHHSRSIAEKIGDTPNLSIVSINLGVLAMRQGNVGEAEHWCQQALMLAERMKDLFYTSLFRGYMAMALIDRGRLDQARGFLLSALKISRSHHFTPCTGLALVVLAHLRIARARASGGNPAQYHRFLVRARRSLQRALVSGKEEAETRIEGEITLAEVLLLLGRLEDAQRQARLARMDAQAHGIVWLGLRALHFLGTIMTAQGRREEGNSLFQQANEELQRRGMRLEYARSLRNYGAVLLQHSSRGAMEHQQGWSYLTQAREIFLRRKERTGPAGLPEGRE